MVKNEDKSWIQKWLLLMKTEEEKIESEYPAITLLIQTLGKPIYIATLYPLLITSYYSHLMSLIIFWWSSFDCATLCIQFLSILI